VPDGIAGNVVVTSFLERAMPLIRYSLGDVGFIEPGPCPCGRTFRTMRLTEGRSEDYITLPDRSRLYCSAFLLLVHLNSNIDECFVEQDEEGTIRFFYIQARTSEIAAPVLEEQIRAAILEKVRQRIPLQVVRAETTRITAGGKGKFVTSRYRPAA
jgi:phenylacetate-CoA ligase